MERLSCRLILPLAQVDDMPEQTVRVHSTKRSRVHWVRPEMVVEALVVIRTECLAVVACWAERMEDRFELSVFLPGTA